MHDSPRLATVQSPGNAIEKIRRPFAQPQSAKADVRLSSILRRTSYSLELWRIALTGSRQVLHETRTRVQPGLSSVVGSKDASFRCRAVPAALSCHVVQGVIRPSHFSDTREVDLLAMRANAVRPPVFASFVHAGLAYDVNDSALVERLDLNGVDLFLSKLCQTRPTLPAVFRVIYERWPACEERAPEN